MTGRRGALTLGLLFAVIAAACATEDGAPSATAASSTVAATSVPPSTAAVTVAPTTTPEPTTTVAPTTTVLPWQRYPQNGVLPLPAGTIDSFSRVNTSDPVVFLTMDDGFVRDPRVPELLAAHHAPVTMFLIDGPVARDPGYWQQLLALGGSINTHTMRHAHLPGMSPEAQQQEICDMHARIEQTFGSVGWFFRPPRGEYDSNTFAAARACGVRALILWRVTVSDGVIDTWGDAPIRPGDIILVHFLKSTVDSLNVLFAELDRLGLTVARLEDYLPAA